MRAIRSSALLFLIGFLFALCASGEEPQTVPTATDDAPFSLPDVTAKPWTGDFDGMVKRRQIRVLTTYSKTLYFVDRGEQHGLVYDAFRLFERDLNKQLQNKHVQVHVLFVPTTVEEMIPALLAGRGDIAAANLTITPERLAQADFAEPSRRHVSEILVTGPGAEPIESVDALSGKDVYIRQSSSFHASLASLNARLAAAGKAPVKVRIAPEELADEDILEMVNAGLVKATIVDDHIAEFWKQIFDQISLHPDVAVRTGGEIAWMIRKDSPRLKGELNAFLDRYPEGSRERNVLFQKYLKSVKFAKAATAPEEVRKLEKLREIFREYGKDYHMDYLLMAAQGYQESRLDHGVRSPVGAIGVMQVMPATGKELGVGDIRELAPNIHAGVKYIRFMMNRYFAKQPMDELNRGLFTFAAYNAGPGRIAKLRKEAAQRGLDPNKWFNNVEVVAAERIGRETVQYVSNIYKYYLAYRLLYEELEERAKAKASVAPEAGSRDQTGH